MQCYRCESPSLELAALWPEERKNYASAGIVLRLCKNCGLEQNHVGDDESRNPHEAAEVAPPYAWRVSPQTVYWDDKAINPPKGECLLCGGKVLEQSCKIRCLNCGFTRDCSDP